jgi:hypothetical protein
MDRGFSQLAVLWEREKTQSIAFRRLKPDATPNVPLASPDPERKKMAKLQLFNTGLFNDLAWISRNKLKSKLRLKSEILLKFEKSQKNAFLEKN